jgi:hypothetical protein
MCDRRILQPSHVDHVVDMANSVHVFWLNAMSVFENGCHADWHSLRVTNKHKVRLQTGAGPKYVPAATIILRNTPDLCVQDAKLRLICT